MLNSGDVFAGFIVERLLGQGGMGSVYLARHARLGRLTALKLMNRELYAEKEIRTRFEREADLVAQLDHPNIVEVYDRGTEDEQLWISMQYIDGVDAAGVNVMTLPPERAVQIIEGVAAALDYAHGMGVLHRDVKPANIILARAVAGHGERVFLTDFGIARLREDSTHLTQAGMFTATLAYASPEQMTGAPLDHTTDQYSLGCALYWLLIGAGPYDSPNPTDLINGHLQLLPPPVSLRRPGLTQAMDAVITKAMAKRPTDRFASCTEFAKAARRALTAKTIQLPPPIPPMPVYPPAYPPMAPGFPQPPGYPAGPYPASPLPPYAAPNYPAPQGYSPPVYAPAQPAAAQPPQPAAPPHAAQPAPPHTAQPAPPLSSQPAPPYAAQPAPSHAPQPAPPHVAQPQPAPPGYGVPSAPTYRTPPPQPAHPAPNPFPGQDDSSQRTDLLPRPGSAHPSAENLSEQRTDLLEQPRLAHQAPLESASAPVDSASAPVDSGPASADSGSVPADSASAPVDSGPVSAESDPARAITESAPRPVVPVRSGPTALGPSGTEQQPAEPGAPGGDAQHSVNAAAVHEDSDAGDSVRGDGAGPESRRTEPAEGQDRAASGSRDPSTSATARATDPAPGAEGDMRPPGFASEGPADPSPTRGKLEPAAAGGHSTISPPQPLASGDRSGPMPLPAASDSGMPDKGAGLPTEAIGRTSGAGLDDRASVAQVSDSATPGDDAEQEDRVERHPVSGAFVPSRGTSGLGALYLRRRGAAKSRASASPDEGPSDSGAKERDAVVGEPLADSAVGEGPSSAKAADYQEDSDDVQIVIGGGVDVPGYAGAGGPRAGDARRSEPGLAPGRFGAEQRPAIGQGRSEPSQTTALLVLGLGLLALVLMLALVVVVVSG
ncbi:serine/threonine protein kinase [Nocardia jejuensis]|uniref:serine/threonine protein kinase n=1 Tax=Nocardia jejuensis TaxID=328049 RepID=UPI000AE4F9EC|nr:serine/threonine-protein kinase [Nocardia jejuensis]